MVFAHFRIVYVAMRACLDDEVFCLAGQSSVGLSFEQPAATILSPPLVPKKVLEDCRLFGAPPEIYYGRPSEGSENSSEPPANELTPFDPNVAMRIIFWSGEKLFLWRLDISHN